MLIPAKAPDEDNRQRAERPGLEVCCFGRPSNQRRRGEEAKAFIKTLCRKKKFAKATHNTWAVILPDGTPIKNDDGESGAGIVILRMLEREERIGEIVVVTRWFGGKKLGGDRFRRVQDCVRIWFEAG